MAVLFFLTGLTQVLAQSGGGQRIPLLPAVATPVAVIATGLVVWKRRKR
jgi:hypothetical protein